jgi:hypothetical protein
MNFQQKLIFYVYPGTIPTRAVPSRNFFLHTGCYLLKKKHVQFNFVFPPHFLANRDINLNNKGQVPGGSTQLYRAV